MIRFKRRRHRDYPISILEKKRRGRSLRRRKDRNSEGAKWVSGGRTFPSIVSSSCSYNSGALKALFLPVSCMNRCNYFMLGTCFKVTEWQPLWNKSGYPQPHMLWGQGPSQILQICALKQVPSQFPKASKDDLVAPDFENSGPQGGMFESLLCTLSQSMVQPHSNRNTFPL